MSRRRRRDEQEEIGSGSTLLGERVRRYRRERGWTQAQLAESADVRPETVSAIERGAERPLPRTAAALARSLGVTVDRLLGLDEQPALFPHPDQRRLQVVRRVLDLDDDAIEELWPRVDRLLRRVEERVRRRADETTGD